MARALSVAEIREKATMVKDFGSLPQDVRITDGSFLRGISTLTRCGPSKIKSKKLAGGGLGVAYEFDEHPSVVVVPSNCGDDLGFTAQEVIGQPMIVRVLEALQYDHKPGIAGVTKAGELAVKANGRLAIWVESSS